MSSTSNNQDSLPNQSSYNQQMLEALNNLGDELDFVK